MIDFNEYIELNEAFNSEPYPVEYKVVGATEFYFFEEDQTKQYKVVINRDTTIPLGKNVRTLFITHKSAGSVFRPIIGKFKDPSRVIATILSILNNYKNDGKLLVS